MRWGLLCISFLWVGVVHASALPSPNLVVSPSTGEVHTSFTFDASDSFAAGGRGGLQYRFKFEDSGDFTGFSGSSKMTYTPTTTGTKRVALEVKDRDGVIQRTYRTYRVVTSITRYARIELLNDNTVVQRGEPVLFRLVVGLPHTEDPDTVTARWDFDSDGTFDTGFVRAKIVSHVYSLPRGGSISPTAEVKFATGEIRTIRGFEIFPSNNPGVRVPTRDYGKVYVRDGSVPPPTLNVSPGKEGFTESTEFIFDASDMRIPQSGYLAWSINGDAFREGDPVLKKRFDAPGTHEVRLRLCLGRVNPNCATSLVRVKVKESPVRVREATIRTSTRYGATSSGSSTNRSLTVKSGEAVTFSPDFSGLSSARVSSGKTFYRWDFQGDGRWDTGFITGSSVTHTYESPGTYRAVVEMFTEDARTDQDFSRSEMMVTVQDDAPPKAEFFVGSPEVLADEITTFTAALYDDSPNTADVQYRWDVDGDGRWDTPFDTNKNVRTRYKEPGEYIVSLQVRDGRGQSTTVRRRVAVSMPPNPAAFVTVSRRAGDLDTVFEFDARESLGSSLTFVWNFPEDSAFESTFDERFVRRRFTTPGEKTIILEVTDSFGRKDRVSFAVFVEHESQYPWRVAQNQ